MIEDGALSHKIDYSPVFQGILNRKEHPNRVTGSEVTAILPERLDFSYWWSFIGGGSAINWATPSRLPEDPFTKFISRPV